MNADIFHRLKRNVRIASINENRRSGWMKSYDARRGVLVLDDAPHVAGVNAWNGDRERACAVQCAGTVEIAVGKSEGCSNVAYLTVEIGNVVSVGRPVNTIVASTTSYILETAGNCRDSKLSISKKSPSLIIDFLYFNLSCTIRQHSVKINVYCRSIVNI